MARPAPTLLFVYNADGGWLNALADMVHKLVSPATYPCSLCALTYGAVAKRPAWRGFLARLGMPTLFLYRDEFRETLDSRDIALPAILLSSDGQRPEVLVSAAELDALADLTALVALLERRLTSASNDPATTPPR
jgi:hypothetical protein